MIDEKQEKNMSMEVNLHRVEVQIGGRTLVLKQENSQSRAMVLLLYLKMTVKCLY